MSTTYSFKLGFSCMFAVRSAPGTAIDNKISWQLVCDHALDHGCPEHFGLHSVHHRHDFGNLWTM